LSGSCRAMTARPPALGCDRVLIAAQWPMDGHEFLIFI
jgi:hypothetical protein